VYAHSAAVLSALRASRAEAAQHRAKTQPTGDRPPLLLFADPQYPKSTASPSLLDVFGPKTCADLRFDKLKATTDEARALIRLFGITDTDRGVNLGANAQVPRLRELPLQLFQYAHFAMHAVLCPGEGRNGWTDAALAFSPTGDEKVGLLRLEEVYELRFDANVITLSACETALGQEINGEGVLGLTRAFLFAGSDSVVSSLWLVNDNSTARLMTEFYGKLLQKRQESGGEPRSIVAALQEAKRQLALGEPVAETAAAGIDTRHPFYWAAFVLYGLPLSPP